MKYIYSTSQRSKLSLILCTFSTTGLVASLFLTSSSLSKVLSYMAFFIIFIDIIYSALTDNIATVSCFFKD